MQTQINGVELRPGMTATTSDGESLGKIAGLYDEEFVIEKGFFFVKDYFLRYEDVQSVSDDTAVLRLKKAEIEKMAQAEDSETKTERYKNVATRGGAGSTTGTSSPGTDFDSDPDTDSSGKPR